MTNHFLESKESLRSLFNAYAKILYQMSIAVGINPDHIVISNLALSGVMSEVRMDMHALRARRNLEKGISRGKIAGSIVFRLCKSQVLTLTPELAENKKALALPVCVAVGLGFEMVGSSYDDWPNSIIRELKYFLGKRHSNQESLGICFDTFACSTPKKDN